MLADTPFNYFSISRSFLQVWSRQRERLHAATCTLVGQMRPAVYETAAVRKYLSLLSHIGEMVGMKGMGFPSLTNQWPHKRRSLREL